MKSFTTLIPLMSFVVCLLFLVVSHLYFEATYVLKGIHPIRELIHMGPAEYIENKQLNEHIEQDFGTKHNVSFSFNGSLLSDRHQVFPRITNKIITEYRPDLEASFQNAVDNNLTASDPKVISLVREMMDQPSQHIIKLSLPLKHTPQSEVMDKYLKKQGMLKNGFFMECGALDGERSSNTIYFEQKYGWQGLLIEVDPYFYTQLMGKNRKAWSINACLSPSDQIQWMNFRGYSHGSGRLVEHTKNTRKVPCFPFESFMVALSRTTVDLFSLDIEGWETPVIKSIDRSKFTVKTWTIEHPIASSIELVNLMTGPQMGYKLLQKVQAPGPYYASDVLFVQKL